MNASRPLGTTRALWIIARLALRRQANIWSNLRIGRKKKEPESANAAVRSATPPKSRKAFIFSTFVLLIMTFNGFNIASVGLLQLSSRVRRIAPSSTIFVSRYTLIKLDDVDRALHRANEFPDLAKRQAYEDAWRRYLDGVLLREVQNNDVPEDEQSRQLQLMEDAFARSGAAGFSGLRGGRLVASADTWPREAATERAFLRLMSLIFLLWFPAIVFGSLGTTNKDLGQVEWSVEWLFTYPAPSPVLFASKLFNYAALAPLLWTLFLPLLVLIFVASGHGWWAIPLGLISAVWAGLLTASVCTFSEVAMRKFLGLGQIKNLQALFTVLGTVLLLLSLASNFSQPLQEFLVRRAESMPWFFSWNPVSLPLWVASPGQDFAQRLWAFFGMLGFGLGAVVASLFGSGWLTRDGLLRAGGPYQGKRNLARRQTPAAHSRNPWLRGVAAHEMLLLSRDRNLMVQVLILPLLLPAYYLLTHTGLVTAVGSNLRNAAMMAFAVGAYSFLNSAMQVLTREDKTLWYLLCFPQSLSSILFKKASVWAAVGLLYAGAMLLLVVTFSRHLQVHGWLDVLLALYGIALYAFIASGIGILATNVLENTPRGRFRTDMVYLYMLLAAVYANTIYSPSLWSKLAQLVLSTLLAVALWQKVQDASPYLLDPTKQPPRTLSLADGMLAILAFFFAQIISLLVLHWASSFSWSEQIAVSYILAGILAGSVTLFTLWRQKVPDLWRSIGLRAPAESSHSFSLVRGVLQGAGWGLVAALGAFAYLRALSLVPTLQKWKSDSELKSFFSHSDKPFWILILAVVAAPLFEEFLFRGLVYQGLRRSTGPAVAVLASAALFALVHPPISVIPVFGLGVVAAITFRQTKILWSSIAAHAVYNACVFLFNRP